MGWGGVGGKGETGTGLQVMVPKLRAAATGRQSERRAAGMFFSTLRGE